MQCDRDKRRVLSPWCVTFGCNECHYQLSNICFSDLSKEDLLKVKKECDYYLDLKDKE